MHLCIFTYMYVHMRRSVCEHIQFTNAFELFIVLNVFVDLKEFVEVIEEAENDNGTLQK